MITIEEVCANQPFNIEYYESFIEEFMALQEKYGIAVGHSGLYLVPRMKARTGYAWLCNDNTVVCHDN